MNMKKKIIYMLAGILYRLFNLFPVKKNRVIFSSFSGKRYGDSPKYISELLHKKCPDVQIIWNKFKGYEFDVPEYVKIVKSPSLAFFYYMATSRIWVDSHIKRQWMKKKKSQFFLNTWHGGLGFKRIMSDVQNADFQKGVEEINSIATAEMVDVFLSNSTWITDIYKSAFNYKGKIVECGFPKNDVFFKDSTEVVSKVKKEFKVAENKKIIVYAPTFRDKPQKSSFDMDFDAVIDAFEKKFNCECVVLVRMHPLMIKESEEYYSYNEKVINATFYSDSQEIILASDFFITDYSSIIFDFMLMKKPGFLYMPDFEQYKKERGFYVDLNYYPFPYAVSSSELTQNIMEFENNRYLDNISRFTKNVGLLDNGKASSTAVKIIIDELKK